MKKIYIAGPMRGYPQFNFPAFMRAEEELKELGWEVVNPARLDVQLDLFDPVAYGDNPIPPMPFSHYIRRDLKALTECDAIALLPGWHGSVGARVEYLAAAAMNLTALALLDSPTWGRLWQQIGLTDPETLVVKGVR